LTGFLRRETLSLQQAAQRADDVVAFAILHAAPAKSFAGDVVYADGADWDPGSGEGLYRRNALNTLWVFIG
jgi:hypothetical protein